MFLKNKVSLVTGGARGIGRQIALTLAREGSKVAIVDILQEESEATKAEIDHLSQGYFVIADVRSVAKIVQAVQQVQEHFGALDILVNAAGISIRATVDELSEEDYDRILDINLKAAYFFSREASKIMMRQKSGRIINIASIRGYQADKTHGAYSITKAGMHAMTRSFAVGLAEHGINVNSVSPGYVLTPMTRHNLDRPGWMEWLRSRVPQARLVEMQEVADAVLFLASDLSAAMTGQDLVIDGGWTAHE